MSKKIAGRGKLDLEIAHDLQENFIGIPVKEAERRRELGVRRRKKGETLNVHKGSNITIGEKAEEVTTSRIEIRNPTSDDAEVTNRTGQKMAIKIPTVEPKREGEYFIQPVDSILDGLLYEPVIIDGHQAVRLNTNHDFYRKVYVPIQTIGVAIQGIDTLIWALLTFPPK